MIPEPTANADPTGATIDDDLLWEHDPASAPTNSAQTVALTASIDHSTIGLRLDQAAAELFSDYSREKLKSWVNTGDLTLNGASVKPKHRCQLGDLLALNVTLQAEHNYAAEAMPLDIVFEDSSIMVINKPAGLVVHPGAGNHTGTLLNGLLAHAPELQLLPRAGLVHRIDKDTTGLLVVAKTLTAQHALAKQLLNKSVYRVYTALVQGRVIAGGTINAPINRHSHDRTKMCVRDGGRDAITHYRVLKHYGDDYTLLQVQLETGRTHQIRVHMAHKGFALLGDSVYNTRAKLPKGLDTADIKQLQSFKRQALHATTLGFIHPVSGDNMVFDAPLPADFVNIQQLLTRLLG